MAEARDVRWQEGNTTARGPDRLCAALDAWQADGFVGGHGSTAEDGWLKGASDSLVSNGVVTPKKGSVSTASKILKCAEAYGFVRARLPRKMLAKDFLGWNRSAGFLTPAGVAILGAYRDADAQGVKSAVAAALSKRQLPSPIERRFKGASLLPAGLTAAVLSGLGAADPSQAYLSQPECALFVQTQDGAADLAQIARNVIGYREALLASATVKDAAMIAAAYSGGGPIKVMSALSYTDVLFRYYEASGLFLSCKLGKARVLRIADDPVLSAKAARMAARAAPGSALADPLSYLSKLESGAFA